MTITSVFRTPIVKPAALAACIALAAPAAWAQAFDTVRLYGAAPGTDRGTLGLAVVAGREYRGSDESRTLLVPVLDYQWGNGWFAGVTNGIGYNFAPAGVAQYGLRLTADLGRKERRSDALRGMGNVDAAAEIGGFFNYKLPQGIFLTSSLRYGSGDDNSGVQIDLGAGYSFTLAPDWRLGTGVATTIVNGDNMQSFFGVTPAQSVTSGYKVYSPGGGVRDVRGNLALTYQIDPRLAVTGAVSVSRLGGDAKDSPLTRERTSTTGVLALDWAF